MDPTSGEFLCHIMPCALINCFVDKHDPNTGMWVFEAEIESGGQQLGVIHLDTISRGTRLLPKNESGFLPNFSYGDALDAFKAYFVNHFINYPAHELITGHQICRSIHSPSSSGKTTKTSMHAVDI